MFGMVNKHKFAKGMMIGVAVGIAAGVMFGMGGTLMSDSDRMRDMQRWMSKGCKKCRSFLCSML